jgi:UDPglucose 6-dehydrogenase
MPAARQRFGQKVTFCAGVYETLEGAHGLVVLTDWQQFRHPDFGFVTKKLERPVIFDGRNLYDPSYVRQAGIEYFCIGRGNC